MFKGVTAFFLLPVLWNAKLFLRGQENEMLKSEIKKEILERLKSGIKLYKVILNVINLRNRFVIDKISPY